MKKSTTLHIPGAYPTPRVAPPTPIQAEDQPPPTNFDDLAKEVGRATSSAVTLSADDQIFLEQMKRLNMSRTFVNHLVAARDTVDRAAEEAPALMSARAELVVETREREKQKAAHRAEEERQWRARLHQEMRERLEAQRKAEAERKARRKAREAELDYRRRQAFAAKVRRDRLQWEKTAAEAQERRVNVDAARRQVEQDRITQRCAADQAEADRARIALESRVVAEREEQARRALEALRTVLDRFALYTAKWEALKGDVPLLHFSQLPWPVLPEITQPEELTYTLLKEFVFHPSRPNFEGKTQKDRLRAEMLKWHPDKFDSKVLCKVLDWQHEAVRDGAGRVVRLLTQMMDEVERENHRM